MICKMPLRAMMMYGRFILPITRGMIRAWNRPTVRNYACIKAYSDNLRNELVKAVGRGMHKK
jgi:hypothetical protein